MGGFLYFSKRARPEAIDVAAKQFDCFCGEILQAMPIGNQLTFPGSETVEQLLLIGLFIHKANVQ
jgi:hypothetical protein